MNHTGSTDHDDEGDLPWDPLWEYVLGEEDDEHRDDSHRRSSTGTQHYHREESRDVGEPSVCANATTILKTLWQRRRWNLMSGSTPTNAIKNKEEWRWELDTSPFALMDGNANNSISAHGNPRNSSNTRKDNSWIGSLQQTRSQRKSS